MTPPTTRDRRPTEAAQLALLRQDVQSHAKTITELVVDQRGTNEDLGELKQAAAVRAERDRNLDDRLARIERSIDEGFKTVKEDVNERFGRLNRPIWIAITTLISTVVAAVATFIIKGGLVG